MPVSEGSVYDELRAAVRDLLRPHLAAVGLDDLPDDGEAQASSAGGPRPGGIGTVEAVEDVRQVLVGDARAWSSTAIVARSPSCRDETLITPPVGVCVRPPARSVGTASCRSRRPRGRARCSAPYSTVTAPSLYSWTVSVSRSSPAEVVGFRSGHRGAASSGWRARRPHVGPRRGSSCSTLKQRR